MPANLFFLFLFQLACSLIHHGFKRHNYVLEKMKKGGYSTAMKWGRNAMDSKKKKKTLSN